jgi:hypothetical protein
LITQILSYPQIAQITQISLFSFPRNEEQLSGNQEFALT